MATAFAKHQPATFTILPYDRFFVLRDDHIPGGTKSRALNALLPSIEQNRVAYAGTLMGHGAYALALAAKAHGKQAHIFIGTDDIEHPMLQKIQDAGALLHLEEPQPIDMLYELAQRWQSANDAFLFPPGFAHHDFEAAMINALQTLDTTAYSEIWVPMVSGTLARCVQAAFPRKPVRTISVVKSGESHFTVPEKYHQKAKSPPPYPACPYTDAKIWQIARQHAPYGALIWNVAG